MDIFDKIIITDVCDAITVNSAKGRYEKMHRRKNYGLSFCIDGQISYVQNGEVYVSDKNHAVILPKDGCYTICGDKNGVFPVINFETSEFLTDRIISVPIKHPDTYISDFEQIKKLFLFEKNRSAIFSIFYNIIYKLSSENDADTGIIAPAISYMETHFSDKALTNSTLAQMCNISEVYFRKLFYGAYGMSPKQYIVDIRINRAKQLLSEGTLKVCAVSEMCGFSNPYHFSRFFKKRTGMTPAEYSKRYRTYKA